MRQRCREVEDQGRDRREQDDERVNLEHRRRCRFIGDRARRQARTQDLGVRPACPAVFSLRTAGKHAALGQRIAELPPDEQHPAIERAEALIAAKAATSLPAPEPHSGSRGRRTGRWIVPPRRPAAAGRRPKRHQNVEHADEKRADHRGARDRPARDRRPVPPGWSRTRSPASRHKVRAAAPAIAGNADRRRQRSHGRRRRRRAREHHQRNQITASSGSDLQIVVTIWISPPAARAPRSATPVSRTTQADRRERPTAGRAKNSRRERRQIADAGRWRSPHS